MLQRSCRGLRRCCEVKVLATSWNWLVAIATLRYKVTAGLVLYRMLDAGIQLSVVVESEWDFRWVTLELKSPITVYLNVHRPCRQRPIIQACHSGAMWNRVCRIRL